MVIDTKIPQATQRIIIEQEVAMWKNTLFQGEVRLRVAKRTGDADRTADALKQIEMAEASLLAYEDELATLVVATDQV